MNRRSFLGMLVGAGAMQTPLRALAALIPVTTSAMPQAQLTVYYNKAFLNALKSNIEGDHLSMFKKPIRYNVELVAGTVAPRPRLFMPMKLGEP